MKQYSKKIRKNKRTLYFYEDTHEYFDDLGFKYISVTTLIHHFFPEFDELEQAKVMSERGGDPVDLILKYWKNIRESAQEHGTNTHLACETFIKENKVLEFKKDKTNRCIKSAIGFIKKQKIGKIISCEKLLFDPINKIAGQCDLIFRNGDTLIVGDWKTNQKITKEAFNNEVGLYPLEDFPNASFWHYFVQLNMYLHLIINGNYYPWAKKFELIIFHIKENEVIEMPLEVNLEIPKKIIQIYKEK